MMYSKRQQLLLLVLSFLISFSGLLISYPKSLAHFKESFLTEGIGRDGLFLDGAEISFPFLSSHSKISFTIDPLLKVRGEPPALHISACDQELIKVVVSERSTYELVLPPGCSGGSARFDVLNPFQLKGDSRRLGARLDEVRVVRALPVIERLLFVTGAIFLLVLCVPNLVIALGGLLLSLVALSFNGSFELDRPFGLWCVAIGLLTGWRFASSGTSRLLIILEEVFNKRTTVLVTIICITLFGLALRLYGIDFGLPQYFHNDEPRKAGIVARMVLNHTLNPEYFYHPSLLLYLSALVTSLLQHLSPYDSMTTTALLAGRIVSVLAGSLSIFVVGLIGRRVGGGVTGVLSAALLAVVPIHVTCSRYMKEDALVTCCVLLIVLSVIYAVQEGKPKFLLLGALCSGLAASAKYSGVLSFLLVAIAPWLASGTLKPSRVFLKWAAFGMLIVPIAFLATTPYAVITPDTFLDGVFTEAGHMGKGHGVKIGPWQEWWVYHFTRSFIPGVSFPVALLVLIGIGIAFRLREKALLYTLGAAILFYLPAEYVNAKVPPQGERYLLTAVPFLLIFAALFVSKLSPSRATVVGGLLLIAPLLRTVELSLQNTHDTRDQAATWIDQNLPPGSKLVSAWRHYGPRINDGKFTVLNGMRPVAPDRIVPEKLKENGAEYIVLSSFFYERYFSLARAPQRSWGFFRRLAQSADLIYIARPQAGWYGFHNPTILVYKLR